MAGPQRSGIGIVWLRRDLRLADNAALYDACRHSEKVCLAFVVHPPLLANGRIGAPIASAFFDALHELRETLRQRGSDLAILRGDFAAELRALARRIGARTLHYNADYEPYAIERDAQVCEALRRDGIEVHESLDHVYFGAEEVVRPDGEPYRIFTPYMRRWLEQRAVSKRPAVPSEKGIRGKLLERAAIEPVPPTPQLRDFGFAASENYPRVTESLARRRLCEFLDGPVERYAADRDIPAIDGTSRLSPHLRAGTIGIRTCVEQAFARRDVSRDAGARASIDAWISELVWREFFQMILRRFPRVTAGPFVPAAERIAWQPPGENFERWCNGCTGYPIVDAAMRQLNTFGWMHNRLRMVSAAFLAKHLLIDWRLGERYFEQRLADADVAQNNGGWQWAASTGADAMPYFRIFNPVAQSKRFDPQGAFIKRMLPELQALPQKFVHEPWRAPQAAAYPPPIVQHEAARRRALAAYTSALRSF